MTFSHPHYLWLLLVLPPALIVFLWWSARLRQNLMTRFIHARLLPGLIAGVSPTRNRIRSACLVMALMALILALAQPQRGYDLEEVRQRGLDIIIAIDTSKSMLAQDIPPNRLDRAKLAALDLMQQASSDRLGLVAFAGTAFLQCPLTFDDAAFRQSLQALDVNTIPEGGTALAGAIQEALKAFKEGDNYKVLVLFTDGEDHDSGALEAAQKAARAGMRIFTVGIGSTEGELLRVKGDTGQSDYIRDENGNVVKSHLNESLLQQIAGAANGFYLPLRGARVIDTLYQKGLAPLPKSDSREKWIRRPRERYHWPLSVAMVLLVMEILFPERRNDRSAELRFGAKTAAERTDGVRSSGFSLLPASTEDKMKFELRTAPNRSSALRTVAMAALLVLPAALQASPSSALREYRSGRYGEAFKEYERALEKNGEDHRLHFNAGTAAYQNRQFDLATQHFNHALSAPDLQLQQQAYYNLGNALYRLGEQMPDPQKRVESWQGAVKQYDTAVKLNTNDADARFNYEFVKKKLEELKQQQKQNQDQNRNQNQNQNQQQQNQQNDQSGNRPQQNSQPQDQQQQPKQNPSEQQQANNQKPPEPKPAQKSSNQEKQEPQPNQPQDQTRATAVGQMTPQEAERMLDSQKNEELMLPVSRKQPPTEQQRPIKDW